MGSLILRAFISGIDQASVRVGKYVSWLIVVAFAEITYDVAMRYLFSAPTAWSYDVSYMMVGTIIILAAPWVLLRNEHVSMDILSGRFSAKTKLIADIIFSLVCFFPLLFFLLRYSFHITWVSVSCKEVSNMSYWRPIIWPFRIIISAGLLLLLLQGAAIFIRKVHSLLGREL